MTSFVCQFLVLLVLCTDLWSAESTWNWLERWFQFLLFQLGCVVWRVCCHSRSWNLNPAAEPWKQWNPMYRVFLCPGFYFILRIYEWNSKRKSNSEGKHSEMAKLDGNNFFRHMGARERYFTYLFLNYSFCHWYIGCTPSTRVLYCLQESICWICY